MLWLSADAALKHELTRRSFLEADDPAPLGCPWTGRRHLRWFSRFSFRSGLWQGEGQRAPYLLGIHLSCRWSLLQSSPCQHKDKAQNLLIEKVGGKERGWGWGGLEEKGQCSVQTWQTPDSLLSPSFGTPRPRYFSVNSPWFVTAAWFTKNIRIRRRKSQFVKETSLFFS